jgi:hypothetical protein
LGYICLSVDTGLIKLFYRCGGIILDGLLTKEGGLGILLFDPLTGLKFETLLELLLGLKWILIFLLLFSLIFNLSIEPDRVISDI